MGLFGPPDVEKMKAKRDVKGLIKALGYEKNAIRKSAAEVVGEIRDASAVVPLIATLEDKDWEIRHSAAEALGKIGDARAVDPLITALKDKDEYVRQATAEALGNLGSLVLSGVRGRTRPEHVAENDRSWYTRTRAA